MSKKDNSALYKRFIDSYTAAKLPGRTKAVVLKEANDIWRQNKNQKILFAIEEAIESLNKDASKTKITSFFTVPTKVSLILLQLDQDRSAQKCVSFRIKQKQVSRENVGFWKTFHFFKRTNMTKPKQ